MTPRVLILGAGFGGLELSTMLSDALGERVEVTLIDRNEAFVFGYSKLDVMFGRTTVNQAQHPYRDFMKPGVRFRQEVITAVDADNRRVTTNAGTYDADYLVVSLGADYDIGATPGLAEHGNEFYTVAGASRLRALLATFTKGRTIVGVCGAPYKCPPAPSETALLLHDQLMQRGVRDQCQITIVLPFAAPVPPSPDTSAALVSAFAERRIDYVPNHTVTSLDGARRVAVLDDGTELPYDLFLGIPKHCVPGVIAASGLAEKGWIAVNPRTLETKFSGVYALGDVANVGVPKAGVFAEGAARAVGSALIARLGGGGQAHDNAGTGSCFVEFGAGRIGRVDVDFFSGPKPTGAFSQPTAMLRAEKELFGSSRRARWFGKSRGATA